MTCNEIENTILLARYFKEQ